MNKSTYITLLAVAALLTFAACDKKASAPTTKPAPTADGHTHKPGDDHDHDHDNGHDHGASTQLGEQTADGLTINASRDGGLKPGSDAPIDVTIVGTAKIIAVRFWIGTEDAKGSMKAKADLEKSNWHTHVQVPEPLQAGSKLWVEVESEGGRKTIVSFDLKA